MTKEEAQAEINGLKNLLAQTDYQAIKFAEGSITEDEYKEERAKRQSFRDKINELEKFISENEAQ